MKNEHEQQDIHAIRAAIGAYKNQVTECPKDKPAKSAEELAADLAQFSGTMDCHRFWLGITFLTDGVKYLADEARCYWLLDIIGSSQPAPPTAPSEPQKERANTQVLLGVRATDIRPAATLTEIVFRKNMGERYFTLWNVIAGFGLLQVFSIPLGVPTPSPAGHDVLGQFYPAQSDFPRMIWVLTFMGWHVALLLYWGLHAWSVRQRYKAGGRWHSRNVGVKRFPFLPVWFEKALPIVAGLFIWQACQVPGFGILMILSGVISIMLRANEASLFWERVLDVIDGQLEQEYLAKAVMERSNPKETEGYTAPLPAYVSQKFRQQFLEAAGAIRTPPVQRQEAAA
jgi:hypothetical protein